jgi:hypothetical protein
VLSVLVFVYPLRMVAASLFSAFSGNWVPAELRVREPADLQFLFAVYSSGYLVLCGFMLALHALAERRSDALSLDLLERHDTRTLVLSWRVQVATAVVSLLVATLREPPAFTSVLAPGLPGFVDCSLAVTLPVLAKRRERGREQLLALRS